MLSRAIESGVRDPALYSALGHIHYEMRDYESAAAIYEQLAELEPLHRIAHFNLGVCRGNLKRWKAAAESFRKAAEADATRSDALAGVGPLPDPQRAPGRGHETARQVPQSLPQ